MTLDSHQTARVAETNRAVHSGSTAPVSAPAQRDLPPAVVVGLCAHGLATTRALAVGGVKVVALEADSRLPGVRTAKATVRSLGPMNGAGLSKTLLQLARESAFPSRPVLFVMNDNMVRDVAENWRELEPWYQLSWSGSTQTVLHLMSKDHLPEICARTNVGFPATLRYASKADHASVAAQMSFPAIVKPAWPMGSFKAVIVNGSEELAEVAAKHERSLPFVVQQWIAGGPTALCFATMYLKEGRVLARFEGRKAFAGADGMGQGTVMEPWPDDTVHETARRFVEGLGLSGPLAVEFKRSPDGRLWLIEPNVGRTEYCVDLCTVNGINLPLMEYRDVLGLEIPQATQRNDRIWFDTDRDPPSWLRFLRQRGLDRRALRPAFPYLNWGDLQPFMYAAKKKLFG